jgi:hypothetical protein
MAKILKTRIGSYSYSVEDAQKAFLKEKIIEIGFIDGIKYFDRKSKKEIKGEQK